jgi:phenylacetate-CoA ligase
VRGMDALGNEFEVIVDKVGDIDRITLKVEILKDRENERPAIEARLRDQLRLTTNLGYKLEFHAYGTLPRYEVKAKRFKDLRKGH